MALGSTIEWTESTWNPVTGCSKVSPGCKHCYAERMSRRLHAMGRPNYRNGFKLTLQPQSLALPLQWKKPQTIFVNSMSDLFHKQVPLAFIQQVFDVMRRARWHRFQVLTKRSERLAQLSDQLVWSPNIWMGVSVETATYTPRINDLRSTGACVKFVSLEPLLGPLPDLDLQDIDWVIVGGESGPKARPMDSAWAIDIRDQCNRAGVPFFFKQWGGVQKKVAEAQGLVRISSRISCSSRPCPAWTCFQDRTRTALSADCSPPSTRGLTSGDEMFLFEFNIGNPF